MKRWALILAAALIAASARAAPDIDVSIADVPEGGQVVDGSFAAPVPADVAWRVLTDYNQIANFITSLKESRIVRRTGDEVLVEQRFAGRFLFFSSMARVLLDIVEEPKGAIRFQDVSAGDFIRYTGYWTIAAFSGGCRVTYHLDALSRARAPHSVKRSVLKSSVSDLLEQVRREMIRRERNADGAATAEAVPSFDAPMAQKGP